MLGNFWFKKEKPLLGLTGLGGGADSKLVGGAGGPITATGGDATYTLNSYTYHVFTSSGSLVVASGIDDVEFLVVGGGGGAGAGESTDYGRSGGGGGAGGFRCSFTGITPGGPSTSPEPGLECNPGTYPVTIGSGGSGYTGGVGSPSNQGADSSFGPPSTPARIVSAGGGYGLGSRNNAGKPSAGGSGGGASAQEQDGYPDTTYPGAPNLGGTANVANTGTNPVLGGYDGGRCASELNMGGGGGGAGAAGEDGSGPMPSPADAGRGGDGKAVPTNMIPASYGTPGPSPGRWFSGGGYASSENKGGTYANAGGGGANPDHWSSATPGSYGIDGTGGGGGGRGDSQTGGDGGDGIVILRYSA